MWGSSEATSSHHTSKFECQLGIKGEGERHGELRIVTGQVINVVQPYVPAVHLKFSAVQLECVRSSVMQPHILWQHTAGMPC